MPQCKNHLTVLHDWRERARIKGKFTQFPKRERIIVYAELGGTIWKLREISIYHFDISHSL